MLGIVSALSLEAKMLTAQPNAFQILPTHATATDNDETTNILLAVSGIGAEAAEKSAMRLVDRGATALVSWGCAGGLVARMNSGDLLLPQAVISTHGEILHTDAIWRNHLMRMLPASLRPHEGILIESRCIVANPAEKRTLAKIAGAVAVDMESAAIGRVARNEGIPFIVIRSVADTLNEGIPDAITSAADAQGNIRIKQLLIPIIRQPRLWPQLIRQGLNFHAASRTLRMVAQQTDRLFHLA
ncbi:MAG: hypothetical protein Q9M25_09370 [Mariprofundaceae bacterium]|nr:hypothetical protein [Mariprofundaceae bacterium]